MSDRERIARAFHDTYEALAHEHGWVTQEASRASWESLPAANRDLMLATVERLINDRVIRPGTVPITGGERYLAERMADPEYRRAYEQAQHRVDNDRITVSRAALYRLVDAVDEIAEA